MKEKEYECKIGMHSRSYSTTLPKDIVENLGVTMGSTITFRLLGDIITLHKTNPVTPIDIITNDVFSLTEKIRNILKKELQMEEEYINGNDPNEKTNSGNRERLLMDIKLTKKELHSEFTRINKNLEKNFW